MRTTPSETRPAHPGWVRLAVLSCLLAWLAAMPGLLPGAVAALGSLDGQHGVQIQRNGAAVSVVLHHENRAPATRHEHSPLAGVLTAFAQASGSAHDHILTFAQSGETAANSRVVLPSKDGTGITPPPAAFTLLPPGTISAFSPIVPPHPAPIPALALRCLRSTTLLI